MSDELNKLVERMDRLIDQAEAGELCSVTVPLADASWLCDIAGGYQNKLENLLSCSRETSKAITEAMCR